MLPEDTTGAHRIIVIGASAGGFEAIKRIVKDLPSDIDASIFIVWHMAYNVQGILPTVLSKLTSIYTAHAYDKEEIKPNRIYVAPPDRHLIIEEGRVRLTHGPKENRFRPAVDPLFRSAAYHYGNRVVGIVLSGALDDGTAGLWRVKESGGIAIVQDPYDAEVPSMPESALHEVAVDYCVPVAEIPTLLSRLSKEKIVPVADVAEDEKTAEEIDIATGDNALKQGSLNMGELSPFTCPECHGVLSKIVEGNIERFRCHTGHAYSVDALMATLTEDVEVSLYNALRGIDESILLLNHVGDHLAEANQPKLAALYFKKAKEAEERGNVIRTTLAGHEQLSRDILLREAKDIENKTQP